MPAIMSDFEVIRLHIFESMKLQEEAKRHGSLSHPAVMAQRKEVELWEMERQRRGLFIPEKRRRAG